MFNLFVSNFPRIKRTKTWIKMNIDTLFVLMVNYLGPCMGVCRGRGARGDGLTPRLFCDAYNCFSFITIWCLKTIAFFSIKEKLFAPYWKILVNALWVHAKIMKNKTWECRIQFQNNHLCSLLQIRRILLIRIFLLCIKASNMFAIKRK